MALDLRWLLVTVTGVAVLVATALVALNFEASTWLETVLRYNSAIESGFGSLPLSGFAYPFVLGIAATFNPCGFAMLPAYLSVYLQDEAQTRVGVGRHLARGVVVSFMMGFGVLTMFGAVGLVIALGINSISDVLKGAFGWAGLTVGGLLVVLGLYLLAGGMLYANWALRASGKVGGSRTGGVRAYYLFGLSFAIASLGCTLPLFLLLVASSFATQGFVAAFTGFVLYALGMCLTIGVLTMATALFKTSLTRYLRSATRYVTPVSGVLIVIAGVYLVLYWLIIGQLEDYFRFLEF